MADPRALVDAYAEAIPPITALAPRQDAAPYAFAALRAVLDLHAPMHDYLPECSHCYEEGQVTNTSYPCPTVRAITEALEARSE